MTDPSIQPTPTNLTAVSVKDFFAQINWYGPQVYDAEGLPLAETPYETVGQFFSTFPWHGTAPATEEWGPDTIGESFPIEDDTLTLEDLSALF